MHLVIYSAVFRMNLSALCSAEVSNLILRPTMRSIWKLLLISLGFTIIGVWMIVEGEGLVAWFVASFFGIGLVVALAQFWPAASYLKLTPKELADLMNDWRRRGFGQGSLST